MVPVVDCVSATQPTAYPDILGLDSKIRNFDVPSRLQMVDSEGVSSNEAMQQAMTSCTREIGECILGFVTSPANVPTLHSITTPAQELCYTGNEFPRLQN